MHFPFVNIGNPPEKRTLRALEKKAIGGVEIGCGDFLGNIVFQRPKAFPRVSPHFPNVPIDIGLSSASWLVQCTSSALCRKSGCADTMGNKYYRRRSKSRKKRYTSRKKKEQTGAEEETEQQEEEQETFEFGGGDAEVCEISGVQDILATPLSPANHAPPRKRTSSDQESEVESPQLKLRRLARVKTYSHATPVTSSPNASTVSPIYILFHLFSAVLKQNVIIIFCLIF
jgi:hypothetical protein